MNPQPFIPEESETFIFVKIFTITWDLNPKPIIPEESVLITRLLELVTNSCSKLINIAKISLDLLGGKITK